MSVTRISIDGPGGTFTQTARIPLTTVFTPPADCTASSAYSKTLWAGHQWAFQLDSGATKPTCYPSQYSAYQYDLGSWYSPGVCPYSFEYVATSVHSQPTGPDVTLAICCPPGIRSLGSTGWSCYDVLSTYGASDSASGTVAASTTLFGNPISVAWQASDLSLFNPPSAPVSQLLMAGITLPTATSSASATSRSAQAASHTSSAGQSSGLSTGAAAGIGVGATIAFLAVVGAIWWFARGFRVTRRDAQQRQPSDEVSAYYANPGGSAQVGPRPMAEIDSTNQRHEIDSHAVRAELESGWYAPGKNTPNGA